MKTFYCSAEVRYFREDCEEVDAPNATVAAEVFAGRFFDDGNDWMRPVEVIVAEDEAGKNAMRFEVTRTQVITDDARELGEVEIPADDDESEVA